MDRREHDRSTNWRYAIWITLSYSTIRDSRCRAKSLMRAIIHPFRKSTPGWSLYASTSSLQTRNWAHIDLGALTRPDRSLRTDDHHASPESFLLLRFSIAGLDSLYRRRSELSRSHSPFSASRTIQEEKTIDALGEYNYDFLENTHDRVLFLSCILYACVHVSVCVSMCVRVCVSECTYARGCVLVYVSVYTYTYLKCRLR